MAGKVYKNGLLYKVVAGLVAWENEAAVADNLLPNGTSLVAWDELAISLFDKRCWP